MVHLPALAVVGDRLLTDLADVTSDLAALEGRGTWAVVIPFEGAPVCARFSTVRPAVPVAGPPVGRRARGDVVEQPRPTPRFEAGVSAIREAIAAGDVYQVNLTRRLSAPLPAGADVAALGAALGRGQPGAVQRGRAAARPRHPRGLGVARALPVPRRVRVVRSSPIKGTAPVAAELLAKDRAENVMIVDLVRNDLGRVCEWGSVQVPSLLAVEEHPGLVHLVSTVEGRLRPGVGWPELIDATFPPGSVTGAPKLAALDHIARLEPCPRGVYCGAVGWVDADRTAGLAQRRHPHVLVRRTAASTSGPAAASPGTPRPPGSGRRPSSRPAGCAGWPAAALVGTGR